MLISINQIDFEDINWNCLPSCPNGLDDNKTMLQNLISIACNLPDYTKVNTGCLKANANPVDLFNALFIKVCQTATNGLTEEDYSKLVPCGNDNWTIANGDTCFTLPSVNPNEFDLIQALMKRINTYSNVIKQQDAQIKILGVNYASLQAQINTLSQKISNCCP